MRKFSFLRFYLLETSRRLRCYSFLRFVRSLWPEPVRLSFLFQFRSDRHCFVANAFVSLPFFLSSSLFLPLFPPPSHLTILPFVFSLDAFSWIFLSGRVFHFLLLFLQRFDRVTFLLLFFPSSSLSSTCILFLLSSFVAVDPKLAPPSSAFSASSAAASSNSSLAELHAAVDKLEEKSRWPACWNHFCNIFCEQLRLVLRQFAEDPTVTNFPDYRQMIDRLKKKIYASQDAKSDEVRAAASIDAAPVAPPAADASAVAGASSASIPPPSHQALLDFISSVSCGSASAAAGPAARASPPASSASAGSDISCSHISPFLPRNCRNAELRSCHVFALDVSGSTKDVSFYWSSVGNLFHQLLSECKSCHSNEVKPKQHIWSSIHSCCQ